MRIQQLWIRLNLRLKRTTRRLGACGLGLLCAVSLAACGVPSATSTESNGVAEVGTDSTEVTKNGEETAEASVETAESADGETSADASAGQTQTTASGDLVTSISDLDLTDLFKDRDLDDSYDIDAATTIEFTEDSGTVTITEEGTYILSGTCSDGQLLIQAPEDAKIQLVLDGLNLTNADSACILVESADKVFLTLAEGSVNSLSDGGSKETAVAEYVQQNEDYTVDGVIFARCNLTINGSGTLAVAAGYKNGIVCKDDLRIVDGDLAITAANHGIEAKDSLRIRGGKLYVESGEDGLNTDNDEEAGKGFLYIGGGSMKIAAGDDGIHAATALIIEDGQIDVTESYEGLEGDSIDILGGTIDVTASDDGLNAALPSASGQEGTGFDPANFGGGDFNPEDFDPSKMGGENGEMPTPPDGEDGTMPTHPTNEDGTMPTPPTNEDGTMPTPPDGTADASDDSTGTENSTDSTGRGFGGFGGGGFGGGGGFDAQPAAYIRISGGSLTVDAGGDGIDSNGYIYIDGGEIQVNGPTNDGDASIDYGSDAIISGGTILALGSSGMAESFGTESTQNSILAYFSESHEAGTTVTLTDASGNVLMTGTSTKSFTSVILSCEELKDGTYTVTAGSESMEVTVDSVSVTAGTSTSSGFGGGGRGGFPGGSFHGGGGRGSREGSNADNKEMPVEQQDTDRQPSEQGKAENSGTSETN